MLFELFCGLSLLFQLIYRTEAAERPKIVVAPSPVTLHQGQTAIFNCTVSSPAEPAILKWINPSDVQISSSGRFHVSNTSLEIRNVQKDDSGFYTCQASNSYGCTSAKADLNVLDPPQPLKFTTVPVNETRTEGDSVTFYCKANGYPIPTMKWSKRNGRLPEGRHSFPSAGSLKLTNLLSSDLGFYVCTAENSQESVSVLVYLHIKGFPKIIQGPISVIVNESASVLLTCIVEGVPEPTVFWTTPNGKSLNYTKQQHSAGQITVLSNHSLLISNVSAWDMGNYTCTALNEIGRQSAIPARVSILSKPLFSVQLQNISKIAAEHLSVDCQVIAYPAVDYLWTFYNGTVITNSRELILTSLVAANEGYYTCIVNNSLGSNEASFYLRIKVPPTFVVRPKDQKVVRGQKASLVCQVRGDPSPVITWYTRGSLVQNSSLYVVSRDGIVLFVNSVTDDNSGLFQCVAKNEAGETSANINLFVVDLPKFTSAPCNQTVNETNQVAWICRAQGPDTPKITWLMKDKNGGKLENITNRATITDDGDLRFSEVTRQDRGFYVCFACNTAGCRTVETFLNVLYPPSFPVSPSPVIVIEGQHAKLECKPDSSPTAIITWRSPSGTVIPGDSYHIVIRSVKSQDTGDYSCNAENKLGSASANVKLTIGTKAKILDFAKRDLDKGKVQLQCQVAGEPKPLVMWYIGLTALPSHKYPYYPVTTQKELQVTEAAVNDGNVSCSAANALATVMKRAKVPNAPNLFTITNIKSSSLVVTWSQALALELIIHFTVEFRLGSEVAWEAVNVSATATDYKIENLHPYSFYVLRIKAVNGLGPSEYSATWNVTTHVAAPSRPRNLTVQVFNAHMLLVSWVTPLSLNGPDNNILYSIQVQIEQNVTGHVMTHIRGFIHHEYNITQLKPDTTYWITVKGGRQPGNDKMMWGPGNQLMGTTLQLVPSTSPLDLTVASNGPNQILLQWRVPSDSILGYHIFYKQLNSTTPYRQAVLLGMQEVSYLITGLKEDTRYTVKARMYSNAGIGPFSAPVIVRTDLGLPAAKDAFMGSGEKLGLGLAIAGIVCGLLFLLIVLIIVARQRRRNKRIRKSFKLSLKSRGLKYVIGKSSQRPSRSESDSNTSRQYNIGQHVEEDIDMQLFERRVHSPDATSRHLAQSDCQGNERIPQEELEEQTEAHLLSTIPQLNMKIDSQRLIWVDAEDTAARDANQGNEQLDKSVDYDVYETPFNKKDIGSSLGMIKSGNGTSEPELFNQVLTEIERGADQKNGLSDRKKPKTKNKGPYREHKSVDGLENKGYTDTFYEGLNNVGVSEGLDIGCTKSESNQGGDSVTKPIVLPNNAIYSQVDLDKKRKRTAALENGEQQTIEVDPIDEQPPDVPPPPRKVSDDSKMSFHIDNANSIIPRGNLNFNGLLDSAPETTHLDPLPDVISRQAGDLVKEAKPVRSRMHEEVSPGLQKRRVASWADDDAPPGDTGLGRNYFIDM